MSLADGPDGPDPQPTHEATAEVGDPVANMLFESLVHHLLEKGVLTKADALSVVQTVAEVKRGHLHSNAEPAAGTRAALHMLERIYGSFEAAADHPAVADGHNVHQLRPPPHRDRPEFPGSD